MSEEKFDPYTGYEIIDGEEVKNEEQTTENINPEENEKQASNQQMNPVREGTDGKSLAAMILGIISIVLMVTCCLSPLAIFTGIAGVILFFMAPKKNSGSKENKAIVGIICSVISIVGSIIIIVIFVVAMVMGSYTSQHDDSWQDYYEHYSTTESDNGTL